MAGVGIEGLNHPVEGGPLGCRYLHERLFHRSHEEMLPEPIGDRSAARDLRVAITAGAVAVAAPEPPLVPQQHRRITARAITDATKAALVTGDIEGSAVVARGSAGRTHLDLERAVNDLGIDDQKPLRSRGTRIASIK